MNLSELFFFKVFPCTYIQKNTIINKIKFHNQKNCYFYHSPNNHDQNIDKNLDDDKRREPISFNNFFEKQLSKIKLSSNNLINIDTTFELDNKDNNFDYYIDSFPLQCSNRDDNCQEKIINLGMNFCKNKYEFNYHMNRYKKNICRFMKVNNICKNKFCYNKHLINDYIKDESSKENIGINHIINSIINNINEDDINNGITDYKKVINKWKTQKGIKFIEIIILYNYILSFENKYLQKYHLAQIRKNFDFFQKWYLNSKYYINPKPSLIQIISPELHKLTNFPKEIPKNNNLLETLGISTNLCYISKYPSIKRTEIIKVVYAMLNSTDGVIIYGGHENNNNIRGINMNRKERDKFKIWFNSEFIKILIKYEDNLKYNFIDIDENNSEQCVLVIEIKKIKGNKFLIQYPAKCLIIKEKFLNRIKGEKNKILDDENIKELDLKEYLEILRRKLLEHYAQKFNVKI